MARNGSGTYVAPSSSWNPAINNTLATSGDWQALLNDIVAALTQSLSRDGQGPMTGNLQMGGNKITGLTAGDGTGQALIYEQLFNQGTEADLASAAITDIGAQLTNFLRITGTTTITSFGTNYKGPRFLRFAGAVLLTNSATLSLPGGANITTAAGDCLIVIPTATLGTADGWKVVAYQSSSVKPLGNVTAGKVLGRDTSGNGVVQELPIAVDSSGNVGIGTGSPSAKLHVYDATSSSILASTSSSDVQIAASSSGFGVVGTVGNYPLVFRTNSAERARIDSSGTFIVGGTNQSNGAKVLSIFNGSTQNGYVSYDSAGASGTTFFMCSLNGTNIGTIARVGATSAVAYNTTSDQRLKSNIEDSVPVLGKLMDLKVRQYDWTEGDLHQDYGFVAQELEPLLSGIVTKGKTEEDIWQLDYSRLTPHLVKAIQELKAINDTQAQAITSLTERITALEAE